MDILPFDDCPERDRDMASQKLASQVVAQNAGKKNETEPKIQLHAQSECPLIQKNDGQKSSPPSRRELNYRFVKSGI